MDSSAASKKVIDITSRIIAKHTVSGTDSSEKIINLGDVRERKVMLLKGKVRAGIYKPDTLKIAKALHAHLFEY